MSYQFDLPYLLSSLPALLRGLLVTFEVSVLSIGAAILIGIAGSAVRVFRIPVLAPIAKWYIELVRNTPYLAQIFFIFYGLPAVGVRLNVFTSGVLALTVWGGAYNIENFRAGMEAVGSGIQDAARALGLSRWDYLRYVALPLGARVSLPAILNTAVSMFKNSAFLEVIGLPEMTFVAVDRMSQSFRTLELFAGIGVIYLGIVLALSGATSLLERRLRRPFARSAA